MGVIVSSVIKCIQVYWGGDHLVNVGEDKNQVEQIENLKAAIEAQTNAIRAQMKEETERTRIQSQRLEVQQLVHLSEEKRNELLGRLITSIDLLEKSHNAIIDMLYENIAPSIINNYNMMATLVDSIKLLFLLLSDLLNDDDRKIEIASQIDVLDEAIAKERLKAMEREIMAHIRRLDALKERRALEGNHSDPSVITEIEDIEEKIEALKEERDTMLTS